MGSSAREAARKCEANATKSATLLHTPPFGGVRRNGKLLATSHFGAVAQLGEHLVCKRGYE